MHGKSEMGQLSVQPGVQKDYKDALEALIHMPTMGLKWSNTVAMHNAICYLSDALQGDREESTSSSSPDDRRSPQNEADDCRPEKRWVPLQLVKQTIEPAKMDYVLTGPYTYPPVAIAPKAYHCQQTKHVNEKEQMRKASHNIIERRRREKINELTQTLATMVPACQQRDGLHPSRVSRLQLKNELINRFCCACELVIGKHYKSCVSHNPIITATSVVCVNSYKIDANHMITMQFSHTHTVCRLFGSSMSLYD